MAQIKPHTLSGFMELLPQPQLQMEAIMEVLRRTYGLYGFTPLDTPAIEAADVLLAKGGGETEKQIYRFQKGDSDLALRFDLTVPLAKYVALHYGELSFPFDFHGDDVMAVRCDGLGNIGPLGNILIADTDDAVACRKACLFRRRTGNGRADDGFWRYRHRIPDR